ncbi:MAG TPA: hypothetical protein PLJ47_05170 [Candidatus Hydrogenedentes bacterium]|nr:hypothetical protein [Candidatus Hydrogenedentota bacterium]HRK33969.1 hypothetical protein [Candidatus Hydrogenedentota bacterium]
MRLRNALLIVVIGLALNVASHAQERRYHGITIDENHRLLIEEIDGILRVGVFERSRFAGDHLIQTPPSGPGISPRVNPAPEYLLEVRSEVLKSSAPNYLQNPGERYRISIHTLKMSVEYENMVEVPAEFARDQLFYEFQKVRELTTGLERQAVEAAAPLVAEIFKEVNLLPAEIFTSVLKSRGGQFRITPGTRQRRKIEPSETFAPKRDFGRPELGATKRSRQREALPPGATQPGDVAAPQIDPQMQRPVERDSE